MIEVLERFDKLTAAGILARAAVAVDDADNPAGGFRLPDEDRIRSALLDEVRRKLQIRQDDKSSPALERVGDALDAERDKLIGPTDSETALKRLAENGDLPSDLYRIHIISNISDFHGNKFSREKDLIELAVRSPDREQHYGPAAKSNDPFLISLFAKFYADKSPLRSFTLLVAGQRHGLDLHVHQAWRLYPTLVNLDGATDLVDMLRRFSDVFGAEISLGEQKGHFILAANLPKNQPIKTSYEQTIPAKGNKKPGKRFITFTSFTQSNPLGDSNQVALAIGIDLSQYKQEIKKFGY